MSSSTSESTNSVEPIIQEIEAFIERLHKHWKPHLRSLILEIKRVEMINSAYRDIRTKDVIASTPASMLPPTDFVKSLFNESINIAQLHRNVSISLQNCELVNNDVLATHPSMTSIANQIEPGTSSNHIKFRVELDMKKQKVFKTAYKLFFRPLLFMILFRRLDNAYYQNYAKYLEYKKKITESSLPEEKTAILLSLWEKTRVDIMKPIDSDVTKYTEQAYSLNFQDIAPDYCSKISLYTHKVLDPTVKDIVQEQKLRVDSTCATFNRAIKDLNSRINELAKTVLRLEKATDSQLEQISVNSKSAG